MKKWLCLLLFALPGLLASLGASAGNAVSDQEAQAIARDAYVYSYAMMESTGGRRRSTRPQADMSAALTCSGIIRSRLRLTTRTS